MTSVSVICTVKNEQALIADFLSSLVEQTRSPDEVIIVDGGSSDATTTVIKSFCDRLPIRLIVADSTNIAKGRNIAIKSATCNVIAASDAGCKLDKNWLKNIIRPIEDNFEVDVVSGFYRPWVTTEFEEIASYLLFFPTEQNTSASSFLPSGRSIAFKKSIWKRVGGYPEWLTTAEDTFFDLKLKENKANFVLAKDAIVYWRMRSNITAIFKQFYGYGKGDGSSLLFLFRYLSSILFVSFMTFFIFFYWGNLSAFFIIFVLVFTIFGFKHLRKIQKPSLARILMASYIALTIEFGTILGFIFGLVKRLKHHLIRLFTCD